MGSDSVEIGTALAAEVVPVAAGAQRERILLVATGLRVAAFVRQAQIDRVGVELQFTQVERR